MKIPILVEPIGNARFAARAGEPFAMCAEGATAKEAATLLIAKLQARLAAGAELLCFEVPTNGAPGVVDPLSYTPTPTDEWFFTELQKEIAENRRLEDEEEQKRWAKEESGA